MRIGLWMFSTTIQLVAGNNYKYSQGADPCDTHPSEGFSFRTWKSLHVAAAAGAKPSVSQVLTIDALDRNPDQLDRESGCILCVSAACYDMGVVRVGGLLSYLSN